MVGDDLTTTVEKKDLCDQHSLNSLSPRSKVVFCTQNNPVKRENRAIEHTLKRDYRDDKFSGTASNLLAVKTDDVATPTVDKQEPNSLSGILLETGGDSSTNSCRAMFTSIQQVLYFPSLSCSEFCTKVD